MPLDSTTLPVTDLNCLELADYIERVPEEMFDMGSLSTKCGTVACIAGHATMLWPEHRRDDGHFDDAALAEKLGLLRWGNETFWFCLDQNGYDLDIDDITRSMAVAHLRRWALDKNLWFDTRD